MDEIEGGDQLIGRCTLSLKRVSSKLPEAPKWCDLTSHDAKRQAGSVLVSLQLVPMDEVSKEKVTSIVPTMKECIFEINCVGVRSLLPFDMEEIVEPHLQFDMGDRSDPSKVKRTKPASRPNGANANFLETVGLPVRLAHDPLYAPTVTIVAFDNRDNGMVQIAVASIDVARLLPWVTVDDNEPVYRGDGAVKILRDDGGARNTEAEQEFNIDISKWNEEDHNLLMFRTPPAKRKKGLKIRDAPGKGQRTIIDVKEIELGAGDDAFDTDEEEKDEALETELEQRLKDIPFFEYNLYREKGTKRTVVGKFKGNFRVVEIAKRNQYLPINLRQIYAPRTLIIRAYIIQARDLVPGRSGTADPYLVLQVGNGGEGKYEDTKEKHLINSLNPDFYRVSELTANIPGDSFLEISVYSKNQFGANDSLIGSTRIDIENRYFSEEWASLEPKPREVRQLTKPGCSGVQGKLVLSLEIMTTQEQLAIPKAQLNAPKLDLWQLRMVIFETTEVPKLPDRPDGLDLFVTAMPDGLEQLSTDIHYVVRDGSSKHNWRFVWDMDLPRKSTPTIKVAIWDKNHLLANEAIGEAIINLGKFYKRATRVRFRQQIEKQIITCTHPAFEGPRGKIELQIDLVPGDYASDNPVGLGRNKPNDDPYLRMPDREGFFDRHFARFGVAYLTKWTSHKYKLAALAVVIMLIVLISLFTNVGKGN
eukprot:c16974_g1_i2.p1 GENE.c16974_g1_i2~~c16974_g1_i2.p1  ORF type:complete len:703 (+),score=135.08 c16974_g1_i2:1854-3962(+)